MDTLSLWLLFLLAGFGTFLIRLSFIELHGSTQKLLERSRNILALLPPAILAALCMPAIIFSHSPGGDVIDIAQTSAAAGAVIVAILSRNVFWPIATGMLILWFLRLVT